MLLQYEIDTSLNANPKVINAVLYVAYKLKTLLFGNCLSLVRLNV